MKKNKKLLLALGTIATIAAPIATVVSCGSNSSSDSSSSWTRPELDKTYTIDKIDDATKTSLANALVAKLNVTKDEAKKRVNAINVNDLQSFRNGTLNDDVKKATMTALEATLLEWSFDNNENSALMKGLQDWVSGAGLATYTSESVGRGPWKTDESQGIANYFRHDLLDLKSAPNFDGYDLLSTTFKSGNDSTIEWYNSVAKLKKGDRVYDPTFKVGTGFSNTALSNVAFSTFRTHVEGEDHAIINPDDGSITWDENNAKTITQKLYDGLKIAVGSSTANITNGAELKAAIADDSSASSITFTSDGTKHYAKVKDKTLEQGDVFNAKDLFYGLVRDLYAEKSVRDEGKAGSQDLTSILSIFSPEEKEKFTALFSNQDSADAFNNPNGYLWDLYGVDLVKTINTNIKLNDSNKFVLEFKQNHLKETSANLLLDNDSISPFHMDSPLQLDANKKISDVFNKFDLDAHVYSGSGEINNLDGFESLAPYVFTEYGMSEGGKQTELLAPDYKDSSKKQVETFTVKVISDGADGASYQDSHLKNFKNAGQPNEHEYLLDPQIKNSKTLLQSLVNYKVLTKPVSVGQSKAVALSWYPTGYKDEGFNDIGKKLFWGHSADNEIESNGDSLKTFFSGTGAQVRDAIKASINWYTMAQTIAPGQHKVFYGAESNTEEFKNSGVDIDEATPEYISSSLKSIYSSNIANAEKAWTSDYAGDAANKLEALAKAAGATEAHPAKIPVLAYIFSQVPNSPEVINANNLVLKRLNSLTPFVKFGNQKELSWDEFVDAAAINSTYPTTLMGFGPDYPGLGSILQQYLGTNGTGAIVGLFKDVLN